MALQLQYETNQGISLPTAYFRVMSFMGGGHGIGVSVAVYADAAARVDDKVPLVYLSYQVPISLFKEGNENGYTAIYNYLKTLPEFSTAIDV